jgi:hypothetical protein
MFNYARYSALAFQTIVIIGGSVFAGVNFDRWLELKIPVFTLLLSILGIGISLYLLVKDILKKNEKNNN